MDKEGPILKTIYDQMPEPKWVISMGVCASSGGFYRSYHVMQGIDEIIPVDVYVPGCPPAPESLIAAVMKIQERIKAGEQAKRPQGEHRVGAPGDGFIDRRARRAAWAKDDAERAQQGLPPRGCPRATRACQRPVHGPGYAHRARPAAVHAGRARPPAVFARAARDRVAAWTTSAATSRSPWAAAGLVEALRRFLRNHPDLDFKLFLDLGGVD